MLAARPLRAREAPVVHVTIDRIEVRAPAPAAPAAPPPARRKPLPCGDSLSDFLRGKRP
jgi:hypothetical protein